MRIAHLILNFRAALGSDAAKLTQEISRLPTSVLINMRNADPQWSTPRQMLHTLEKNRAPLQRLSPPLPVRPTPSSVANAKPIAADATCTNPVGGLEDRGSWLHRSWPGPERGQPTVSGLEDRVSWLHRSWPAPEGEEPAVSGLEDRASWLHRSLARLLQGAPSGKRMLCANAAPLPVTDIAEKSHAVVAPALEALPAYAREPHTGDVTDTAGGALHTLDLMVACAAGAAQPIESGSGKSAHVLLPATEPLISSAGGCDSGIESYADDDDNVWDEEWEPLTREEQADDAFDRHSSDIEAFDTYNIGKFFDARNPMASTIASMKQAGPATEVATVIDPRSRLLADIVAAQQRRASRVAIIGRGSDVPASDAEQPGSPSSSQIHLWQKAFAQMVRNHSDGLANSDDDSIVAHLPDDSASWETDA